MVIGLRSRLECRGRFITAALLLLATGASPAWSTPLEVTAPRHMEYRIAWNGIPAASATIEVKPEQYAGDLGYQINAQAATNPFIDLFWRFRGNARATCLKDRLKPLRFTYERRTNSTPELTWIDFDLGEARAQSVYIKRERRRELDAIGADLVDPITAAFRALSSDAKVGDSLSYRVFTGESHYRVVLAIRAEEVIDVPAGRFEALRVEPEIIKIKEGEKPDKRLQGASIWVTRAPVRTLLRIRGEVFIGAVTLDLVRLDGTVSEQATGSRGTLKADVGTGTVVVTDRSCAA